MNVERKAMASFLWGFVGGGLVFGLSAAIFMGDKMDDQMAAAAELRLQSATTAFIMGACNGSPQRCERTIRHRNNEYTLFQGQPFAAEGNGQAVLLPNDCLGIDIDAGRSASCIVERPISETEPESPSYY